MSEIYVQHARDHTLKKTPTHTRNVSKMLINCMVPCASYLLMIVTETTMRQKMKRKNMHNTKQKTKAPKQRSAKMKNIAADLICISMEMELIFSFSPLFCLMLFLFCLFCVRYEIEKRISFPCMRYADDHHFIIERRMATTNNNNKIANQHTKHTKHTNTHIEKAILVPLISIFSWP